MDINGQRNGATQVDERLPDPRMLLQRLTELGLPEIEAAQLVLAHPKRRLARAIDAFEVLGDDRDADAHTWISRAVEEPERIERVFERHQGWETWYRQHRSWEVADAARAEQERRSRGWGAAVSAALDDDQLADAAEQVTQPIGVLGRRSVPVARAQVLAWAVAVHQSHPGVPLHQALTADLDGSTTSPDHLDQGLPEPPPPAEPRSRDDLSERLAMALGQLADLEPEQPPEPARRPPRASERTPEHVLEREV